MRAEFEQGFSSNPLLDRCKDRLIIEAIQFYEHHRVRCRGWSQSIVSARN